MVVDTSVLLAVFFDEPHAYWCAGQLDAHADELMMSTVNLAETLIRVRDRQPNDFPRIRDELLNGGIHFVPPDMEQAEIAADARLRYPLNLGDCFAYALAKTLDRPILTLDEDFVKSDLQVVMP